MGHVAALLLSFALSSLAGLQKASGLLWMGYLLLSLLVLVRGTWRPTLSSRWEAATGGGAAWRALRRYAWAVPLLVVAYQAPPVTAQRTLVLITKLMTPIPSATIPTTTTYCHTQRHQAPLVPDECLQPVGSEAEGGGL